MQEKYGKIARKITEWSGTLVATTLAFTLVISWVIGGIWFGYGTDYQIIINTSTTIVTFLMVFLIQNAQNRDAVAIHLKLDDLLTRIKEADTKVAGVEDATEEELEHLRDEIKDERT